jgi:hypothetical protein
MVVPEPSSLISGLIATFVSILIGYKRKSIFG